MILLSLIAHFVLMLIFMCGIGFSWVYKSVFGLLFFGIGLVTSVSFMIEEDIPKIRKRLKGLKDE